MSAKRLKPKLVGLLIVLIILVSFYAFHSFSMWHNAIVLSSDASSASSLHAKTAEWLSGRLKQNETALVTFPDVYRVVDPKLSGKLIEYRSLWDSAGVKIGQRGYEEDVLKVRSYFIDFLRENPELRYVVHGWGDPYSTYLYEVTDTDELMLLLREVATFSFVLSTGWTAKITIYERVEYATLFAMDFSILPVQFSTLPRDVLVQYDSDGVTIHKAGPHVGFYLPLEEGINSSKQNYLTMQIKLDIEDLELTLRFYYDKNKDGIFSGYEIDYVKSARFYQTEQGWISNEWYTIYQVIPKANDPSIQIGIIMEGNKHGTLILNNLIVYTQKTTDVEY